MEHCGLPVSSAGRWGGRETRRASKKSKCGFGGGGGRGGGREGNILVEVRSSKTLKRLQPLQGLGQCLLCPHLLFFYGILNTHKMYKIYMCCVLSGCEVSSLSATTRLRRERFPAPWELPLLCLLEITIVLI